MERSSRKKIFLELLGFSLLMIFTFWLILKDQNIEEIFTVIKNADYKFVFIGIIAMFIYLSLEAVNVGRTLKALGVKSSFIKNLKYTFIGFFFSSITPAASGGQPMEIYYMHKDKIPVSHGTLALLIHLTSMQIITITIALVSLLFNYTFLTPFLIGFFILGISLNAAALGLLVIAVFSKKLTQGLINIAVKVMTFFKIKNIEDKKSKLEAEVKKYQESAVYIKHNKVLMLKVLLTTLVQFLIYYSIAYWTYRALGYNQAHILKIITMQAVLFATVSGIPSPGAVGVSEGAFIEIFKGVYPQTMISSATLLQRCINFYAYVLIAGAIVVINEIRVDFIHEKINKNQNNNDDIKSIE